MKSGQTTPEPSPHANMTLVFISCQQRICPTAESHVSLGQSRAMFMLLRQMTLSLLRQTIQYSSCTRRTASSCWPLPIKEAEIDQLDNESHGLSSQAVSKGIKMQDSHPCCVCKDTSRVQGSSHRTSGTHSQVRIRPTGTKAHHAVCDANMIK